MDETWIIKILNTAWPFIWTAISYLQSLICSSSKYCNHSEWTSTVMSHTGNAGIKLYAIAVEISHACSEIQ